MTAHADYPYLIIGGGMAADAAARGIRELDSSRPIGIVGAEPDPPYARPPLSKALWKGEPLDTVWKKTAEAGVDLHLGRRAVSLDPRRKRVIDDRGAEYGFDKLLLATGGTPRHLPLASGDAKAEDDERVIHFRTLADYRRLRALAEPGRHFAVVGGGFIGSEIAAALATQGGEVTMLFPGPGIGARLFPTDLALFLDDYYRGKGVDVRPNERVIRVEPGARGGVDVETQSGLRLTVEAVVAGLGILPNTELAVAAGLAVDDGVVVDERLRTSHSDVFAAGDVARFTAPALGRRLRVEHEDNALAMGRAAGRSMADDPAPYTHLPFFYSDLFDLGYEAVGEMDPRGETVADWKEPFREGVVYHLEGGRVRGVLLWNTWGQVDAARALIAEPGPLRPADLLGRLPA